jgi:hypothetical protein
LYFILPVNYQKFSLLFQINVYTALKYLYKQYNLILIKFFWAGGSALKMDTEHYSETSASTNQSMRRLKPKEHHQNRHRRENLKSNTIWCLRSFLVPFSCPELLRFIHTLFPWHRWISHFSYFSIRLHVILSPRYSRAI